VSLATPDSAVSRWTEKASHHLSPRTPERTSWDADALLALLDEVEDRYAVDPDRVYLTGVSMGDREPGGSLRYIQNALPPLLRSAASVIQAPRLANFPIWVFHGAKDDLVPLQASQEMVDF
jgi:predicted peptidase